ncbi:hypothetical protein, partial [Caldithrix abyssi]
NFASFHISKPYPNNLNLIYLKRFLVIALFPMGEMDGAHSISPIRRRPAVPHPYPSKFAIRNSQFVIRNL